MKFNSSLLRERFTILESAPNAQGKRMQIIALSTRMNVALQSGNLPNERYVVRAHNMHTCARMAGKILLDYEKRGPILNRGVPLNWQELWEDCLTPYERTYFETRWVAIYNNGKPIYENGEHHAFLDVIEKCDAVNKKDYDNSLKMAEDAFKKAGKTVDLRYDSNVALVADLDPSLSRCSTLLRNPDRTSTFSVTIMEKGTSGKMNISLGLNATAAFLEGVQLAYFVGIQSEKLRRGMFDRFSAEGKRLREARERIARLEVEITAIENAYNVRYRPERPNFHETIMITERLAKAKKLDLGDNKNEQYIT